MDCGTILPVTWLSFTAGRQVNTSILKWQTTSEQNTAYFAVERSSSDGTFERIGTVQAAGNTNATRSYSFVDAAPRKTANFYRIKQVDNDGRFTYTPVRLLNFDEATSGSLLVYPVPARTRLIVSLPIQLEGLTTVTIHSADGRLVQQQQVPVQGGGQLMDLNISALPNGVYHVKAATIHKQVSATFVKQ
ncbi:MAG: T9SS type A sorting domain-containing protein [Chitinophagaceae bacterium]|nr:MAG: T9SS type A sorting domain-containing protein [Chitinophagaceae bacterium]